MSRSRVLLALTCASLATAFLAFYTPLPQVADEHLALPIARAVADSTLYPASDLLVSSGLRGPFQLYRAAGLLYANGVDVDGVWYWLLIAALTGTFVALWALAAGVTRSPWIASIVTAILAAANPYRGTLHWFLLPQSNLVTSTLATPFAISALALAVWGRTGAGLIVAALTFNLHPSIGLVTTAAIAVAMIAERERTGRERVAWFAAAAAAALPNVLYVALNASANFEMIPVAPGLSFAALFGIYADHAYIADHWRENYGWFVLQIGGMIALRRALPRESARTTAALTAAFIAMAALWLVALYTVNYSGITLVFGLRGMAFVKALAFAAVAGGLAQWVAAVDGRTRVLRAATVAALFVAALHKNLDIGEGLAATAWGAFVALTYGPRHRATLLVAIALAAAGLAQVLGQGWGVLGIAQFSAGGIDAARIATIIAAAMMLIVAALAPPHDAAHPGAEIQARTPWMAVVACAAVLAFTVALRGRLDRLAPTSLTEIRQARRLAAPDTTVADLVRWISRGTPAGALIALPPIDPRFSVVRLAAGRGVFATLGDVNQLAYDAAQYGMAHARLVAQGVVVAGRHRFDAAAWDTLGVERVTAIARDGADFAVFDASQRRTNPLAWPVVYRDERWVAYDIRGARVP